MTDDSRSFLSQQGCVDLCQRIERVTHGGGTTSVSVSSSWQSSIRWARNRVMVLGDAQDHELLIGRAGFAEGVGSGGVRVNQIDDASLQAAVQYVERSQQTGMRRPRGLSLAEPDYVYPQTAIWSDRTYAQTAEDRVAVVRELTDLAEQAGLLSAGDIEVAAIGTASYVTNRRLLYAPMTQARCSITVRDPDGTGSGWAGRSSYDWQRFDARALAVIALDKCQRSRNPVRIEPGRYTTILEPQATYDFVIQPLLDSNINNFFWESSSSEYPFYEPSEIVPVNTLHTGMPFRVAKTKIGQQLVDSRFTVSYSPEDPDLGVLPWVGSVNREPVRAATWFDRGVLTQLEYESSEHRPGTNGGQAYRMTGGSTSIEEMIESTTRGLLVTRFSGVTRIDTKSLLLNGVTRDGVWLIEHGKISKAVKNMRFTESPLLALNNLDQLGAPVPVFSPAAPAVVPAIKVRDFSFTALTDAV